MKKALFILGGVAMFAFASCNGKSDCDCTVKIGDANPVVVPVTEFDGDCNEISATDLPEEWRDVEDPEVGGSFECVEQ